MVCRYLQVSERNERTRIKRSLKKGINVITAVGCIIYAAFQGGTEGGKSQICVTFRVGVQGNSFSLRISSEWKRICKLDG